MEDLKTVMLNVFSKKEILNNYENTNIHKDGHIVYLQTSGNPIQDENGNLTGYRGADRDITKRKYAEVMLMHSEEKFNKAFHNSPDAIIITRTSDGLFSEINEAFEKISGYTREEIIGMTSSDLNLWVNANDRDHFLSILKQKRRVTDFKSLFKTKLDAIRNVTLSGEMYEVNGENYILAIIRDITEQLQSEEALKKSEARFRSYFDLSGVGVAITSPSTGWVEVNDRLCRMLGYSSEEIYKSTWPQLTHPDDLGIDLENFAQVISGKIDEYSIDKRFLRKDGETIWTNLSVRCVRDQSGQVDYFVALLFDITERKRVETELIKAKLKAEESDRLKTAFLHNVSHEIRTPLNAILGFVALLSEPELSPDLQASYMETIQEGSDQLLSIISTIVDISSAEAKILNKNVTTFNLNSTLKSLFKQFLLKAPENSNSLNMKPGLKDEDAFISSDSTRFIQIISNLLNNALKFTKNGIVEFGYTVNDTMIDFYVSDTGIGIPSDELSKIFNSFYQVESTLDRKYGGTGLGLSLCKAYVELLGGKIWVTSELSAGSTFYFTIPFDKYETSSPIKPIEKEIEEIKTKISHVLLVAEDDENNYNLISIFLSDHNVTILRARNGQEAVDLCKSNKDIELILMDINMPVMDGYTATRLIKEIRPEVPVIAQTAYADDRIEALKSGCVDFIAKPFNKDSLLRVINIYLVK
jgi:PAS domain S-box-containing protein